MLTDYEMISIASRAVESARFAIKEKQKPVQEIRMGRIKAAVWENDTENGVRYNVTISRLYKDKSIL